MLDSIEKFMNWLTDMDGGWWPFLFLRPDKSEDITTALVAKMSIYYGFPTGVILTILFRHWIVIPAMVVAFFVGYRLTFAIFWNRRARRLRRSNAEPS